MSWGHSGLQNVVVFDLFQECKEGLLARQLLPYVIEAASGKKVSITTDIEKAADKIQQSYQNNLKHN